MQSPEKKDADQWKKYRSIRRSFLLVCWFVGLGGQSSRLLKLFRCSVQLFLVLDSSTSSLVELVLLRQNPEAQARPDRFQEDPLPRSPQIFSFSDGQRWNQGD